MEEDPLNLSLPRATQNFLRAETKKRGFRSVSAYLKALVEDERRAVEEDLAEIDEKLLEGMKGKSVPVTEKTWENLHSRLEHSIAKMKNTYTACFVRSGKWWAAWAAEVPGAVTQGRSLAEARRNLKEAVQMMLEDSISRNVKQAKKLSKKPVVEKMKIEVPFCEIHLAR
jgi:predicted RNase H-like HicB family nuclease